MMSVPPSLNGKLESQGAQDRKILLSLQAGRPLADSADSQSFLLFKDLRD